MNLFINTSAIYTDPFWKRNFARELLENARDKRINIYIADVVTRELRHNYGKQIEKEINSLKNSNGKIRKLANRHIPISVPELGGYLEDFDTHYEYFFNNDSIVKLQSSNELFEELLDRAIDEKKPFTAHKSEFKDAVIWTTYYTYAKKNMLTDCYLITNNVTDFCEPGNKRELHHELKSDYEAFEIYHTLEEFYKEHKEFIDQPKSDFRNWIESENIDEDYVYELLIDETLEIVQDEIYSKYDNMDPASLSHESLFIPSGGYIEVGDLSDGGFEDIDVDIIRDYAIISGVMNIGVELKLYGYDSDRERGEEKHPYIGSINDDVKIFFNFVYSHGRAVTNFEVTDVL